MVPRIHFSFTWISLERRVVCSQFNGVHFIFNSPIVYASIWFHKARHLKEGEKENKPKVGRSIIFLATFSIYLYWPCVHRACFIFLNVGILMFFFFCFFISTLWLPCRLIRAAPNENGLSCKWLPLSQILFDFGLLFIFCHFIYRCHSNERYNTIPELKSIAK